ncbi:MAG: CDP-alcohol phosphatidyltransferase family protein [Promethearchaeota archaeon]
MGIIFLPKKAFKVKGKPFYLNKVCGVSILERNINALRRKEIKDIFIIAPKAEQLEENIKAIEKKCRTLKILENFRGLYDIFNGELDGEEPYYAVILDGNNLIDDRIIESITSEDYDTIYERGKKLNTNYPNGEAEMALAVKINLLEHKELLRNNLSSYKDLILELRNKGVILQTTDIINEYKKDMRRNVPLYTVTFRKAEDFKIAKKILVKQTQKGTLDLIAWYINRPLENLFVRALANTRITANHITYAVNVLAFISVYLFLTLNWWYGLGLLFLINVLDGVDGKLARLREKEGKVGHIEHSFDQLYEQSIYVGVGLGAYFIFGQFYIIIILLIMLLADSFNRHCSMQYKEVMGITLADSSRFDQLFRRFDGRRNIYTLHILFWGLLGYFEFAIFTMCIHAIITGIIYSVQAIRHMKAYDKEHY